MATKSKAENKRNISSELEPNARETNRFRELFDNRNQKFTATEIGQRINCFPKGNLKLIDKDNQEIRSSSEVYKVGKSVLYMWTDGFMSSVFADICDIKYEQKTRNIFYN